MTIRVNSINGNEGFCYGLPVCVRHAENTCTENKKDIMKKRGVLGTYFILPVGLI